jgi:aspartokinase/homoserine dehydrogenase 1
LYETNVGAGLPLIDTIKLLHLFRTKISKNRVFSGTLSYLFNNSLPKIFHLAKFKEADITGSLEPDLERLCGNDVGRKIIDSG